MALRNGFAARLVAAAALVGGAVLALAGSARADKGLNDGFYRDRDEKQHPWAIQRSHLLMWNEQPYAPAGVVFHSRYLKSPTADNLQADQAQMDQLKAAGVLDVWIEPDRGLLENTVAQTQAVIDALESRGFRYGLRVGDRARNPLIGFSPTLTPLHVPPQRLQPGANETWTVAAPAGRRAIFALVDQPNRKTTNWVVGSGETMIEKDRGVVQVQIRKTSLLGKVPGTLLVVPEIQVEPEELGSFGDLWEGMASYAARLKTHLQAVKFGPGLRFILDPFAAGDGTPGQEDLVFPSSNAFRTAFRDWLKRRGGLATLNNRWRTNDQRFPGFDEASRLVPMWSRHDPPDGDGWLMDPVDRSFYRVVARDCAIWEDMAEFRAESLKRWMNQVCTTLRQEGLNVPMLFSWSGYHPIFINSPSPAGYDGLGGQFYGASDSVTRDAAYALGQAEESDRNTWLVATRLAGPQNSSGKAEPIADGASLLKAWQGIRSAGFRGLYLDPTQCPNAVSLAKEAQSSLTADLPSLQAKTQELFFPVALASSDRLTRFANGVWWLPSGKPARLSRFGDTVLAYEMDFPFGDEHEVRRGTVIWSAAGKKDLSFYDDKSSKITFYDTAGHPLPHRGKKFETICTVSAEPIVAVGAEGETLFPLELSADLLAEFQYLLTQAEKQKLDSAGLRPIYDQAEKVLTPATASQIYNNVLPYVERLRRELQPFLWIEGESSSSHNFSSVSFQAGCSSGTYLKVDLPRAPASGAYQAVYGFDVGRDASYDLWIAGRIPGKTASPMLWQLDDEPAAPVKGENAQSTEYCSGMAWINLGRITLKTGHHELVLVVTEKSPAGRYQAGIDAIVISQAAFKPNGVEKPRLLVSLPDEDPKKPKKDDRKSDDKKADDKKADDRRRDEKKSDDKKPDEKSDDKGKKKDG